MIAVCGLLFWGALGMTLAQGIGPEQPATNPAAPKIMNLEECLNQAMEKNRRRPASRFAVAAAEAQHRQSLAGYWPQVNLQMAWEIKDQAPNFLFPARSIPVPAQSYTVPPGVAVVTLPAGIFGPDPVQLPVAFPAQQVNSPAQAIPVPPQEVRLQDPMSGFGSVSLAWLLYDGGMRSGYRQQARAGLDVALAEARRTELEISDSVKRMYYGAVLAKQLRELGSDTLVRMETTLSLTETMYKEGSGTKVTKADYLDNKMTVESIRSMVALLEKNEAMAQFALANTMGLSWRENIQPADTQIPFEPYPAKLDELVAAAYQFNPDWAQLEAGIRAAEGALKTAKSGFFPKIALTGELHQWWNRDEAGMATVENKQGWTVGIGMQIPLFDGFLTRNKVSEARAGAGKIHEQKFLLQEGIGLQIKDIVLGMEAARKSCLATEEAMKAATENRDLNTRAYQNELVETEKVIRAQLMEALMTAQRNMTRYEHVRLQSQLNLLIGAEVWKRLGAKP